MDTFARFGRWWERSPQKWYLNLLRNLRSQLTWLDFFIGFCFVVCISIILIGFRYQIIPNYRLGQIADQDLRAGQDVSYEDPTATALKRAEAEAAVPSLYQLDAERIGELEKTIAAAFSRGRRILTDSSSTEKSSNPPCDRECLKKLGAEVGGTFSAGLIPVLLRQNYSSAIENRMLKILDTVLRDGIISDRASFLKDQRTGIIIRDSSFPFEHPLSESYVPRDLSAAREYLRQFHSDFSELPPRDRTIIIQYLESALVPTLLYNRTETESRRAQAAMRVPRVELQIRQGQTIVRSGEQVTIGILLQLEALKRLQRPRSLIWQFGGYFLLGAILVYSLWRYLVLYQVRHRKIRNHMTLMLVIIVSELLTIRLATALADIFGERFQRFHDPTVLYYGIPLAFGALLTTLLVDVNLGIVASMILAILTGLFYSNVDVAAYLIIGSLAGIYSIRQYRNRAAILKAGLTIGIVNILSLTGLGILRQIPWTFADVAYQLGLSLLSGVLASALASMFLPALESIFKIVTDIRLLELSNLNAPILRRLSVDAPGTYHHSLMVATLAEVAAESIGANSLLARVAAYYHDMGKMLKPEYFVENQAYGGNKHEELSPSISCGILSSHVKDGLQMAREMGLPQRISDMIPQHHGTRLMAFFYQKAKESANKDSPVGIVDAEYRYPGPKPQSRESAIIMMADSVEAASRTLSEPTPALVRGMVDRLVGDIVSDNQLDECDITLREVQLVKDSFTKILSGIFHHRIDYPGYDFRQVGENSKEGTAQDPSPEQTTAV
jgi:cyclic-di-AMP phosphodiesterase PgpH